MSEDERGSSPLLDGAVIGRNETSRLSIRMPDPEIVLRVGPIAIHKDGAVDYPAGTDLDEAAQTFWAALGRRYLNVRACDRCGGNGMDPGWLAES